MSLRWQAGAKQLAKEAYSFPAILRACQGVIDGKARMTDLLKLVFDSGDERLQLTALTLMRHCVDNEPEYPREIVAAMLNMRADGNVFIKTVQLLLPLVAKFQVRGNDLPAMFEYLISRADEARVAEAALRQLVSRVFEQSTQPQLLLSDDDRTFESQCKQYELENALQLTAYLVFRDVVNCATDAQAATYVSAINELSQEFACELLESVMSEHYSLFLRQTNFVALLTKTLVPFVCRVISDSQTSHSLLVRTHRLALIMLKFGFVNELIEPVLMSTLPANILALEVCLSLLHHGESIENEVMWNAVTLIVVSSPSGDIKTPSALVIDQLDADSMPNVDGAQRVGRAWSCALSQVELLASKMAGALIQGTKPLDLTVKNDCYPDGTNVVTLSPDFVHNAATSHQMLTPMFIYVIDRCYLLSPDFLSTVLKHLVQLAVICALNRDEDLFSRMFQLLAVHVTKFRDDPLGVELVRCMANIAHCLSWYLSSEHWLTLHNAVAVLTLQESESITAFGALYTECQSYDDVVLQRSISALWLASDQTIIVTRVKRLESCMLLNLSRLTKMDMLRNACVAHFCNVATNADIELRTAACLSLCKVAEALAHHNDSTLALQLLKQLMVASNYNQDVMLAPLMSLNKLLQICGNNMNGDSFKLTFTMLEVASMLSLPLLRAAFASVQLVCGQYLRLLTRHGVDQVMVCIAGYCRQELDVNISLTSVNYIWTVCDSVSKYHSQDFQLQFAVLSQLLDLCIEDRHDLCTSSLQTVFRSILSTFGPLWLAEQWRHVLQDIILPTLIRVRQQCITALDEVLQMRVVDATNIDQILIQLDIESTADLSESQAAIAKQQRHSIEVRSTIVTQLVQIVQQYHGVLLATQDMQEFWYTLLEFVAEDVASLRHVGGTIIHCRHHHDVARPSVKAFASLVEILVESSSQEMLAVCYGRWRLMCSHMNQRKHVLQVLVDCLAVYDLLKPHSFEFNGVFDFRVEDVVCAELAAVGISLISVLVDEQKPAELQPMLDALVDLLTVNDMRISARAQVSFQLSATPRVYSNARHVINLRDEDRMTTTQSIVSRFLFGDIIPSEKLPKVVRVVQVQSLYSLLVSGPLNVSHNDAFLATILRIIKLPFGAQVVDYIAGAQQVNIWTSWRHHKSAGVVPLTYFALTTGLVTAVQVTFGNEHFVSILSASAISELLESLGFAIAACFDDAVGDSSQRDQLQVLWRALMNCFSTMAVATIRLNVSDVMTVIICVCGKIMKCSWLHTGDSSSKFAQADDQLLLLVIRAVAESFLQTQVRVSDDCMNQFAEQMVNAALKSLFIHRFISDLVLKSNAVVGCRQRSPGNSRRLAVKWLQLLFDVSLANDSQVSKITLQLLKQSCQAMLARGLGVSGRLPDVVQLLRKLTELPTSDRSRKLIYFLQAELAVIAKDQHHEAAELAEQCMRQLGV